jgi:hypothetical protein
MAWSGLRFFGLRAKNGAAGDGIAALQVMAGERRATAGQRPERRQLRSCGRRQFIFFIAQQSDPAVWLKLLVISGAARHRLCRFVS